MTKVAQKFSDVAVAPHISVDCVITAGRIGDIIQINVGTKDLVTDESGKSELVISPSAHLRISVPAVKELLLTISGCLKAAEQASNLTNVEGSA